VCVKIEPIKRLYKVATAYENRVVERLTRARYQK